jgi:hypothetical protein
MPSCSRGTSSCICQLTCALRVDNALAQRRLPAVKPAKQSQTVGASRHMSQLTCALRV